jgi:hypothetical protein
MGAFTMKIKKLPVDVHDFENMITGDHVYVDKTQYLHKMATEGTYYFLSRPRRFGKTLLVSTLEHLFKGNKALFKGLWIENSDWDWTPHPAIRIDFSEIKATTPQALEKSLSATLGRFAEMESLHLKTNVLTNKFVELILGLHGKYGQKVVVLVDEYDKPLINHLGKGERALETAKQNREVLREFYGVLKGGNVGKALKFVFLTGISKFARVSIFSELNNLNDITMQEPYSALLGYTDEELERSFEPHIQQLSKRLNVSVEETLRDIRLWYNGYRFSDLDLKVYNPFSVTKLLKQCKFQNYWFETATPAFLMNLITERDYPIPAIETLELAQQDFSVYDLDDLELEPLLFQTGYVTIKDQQGELYRLGYPNQEVKNSFLNFLYNKLVRLPNKGLQAQYKKLNLHLRQERLDTFIEVANAILSAIPYDHIGRRDEHYYHTVFYLMLSASGVLVQTEPLNSMGRIDMEVYFPDKVYIVELKCNQSAEQAIAQIKAKRYFEKHLHSGRKILLLGIHFSTEERRITDWRVEACG